MPGTLTPPLEDTDHVLGSREAPLELVMYGDFQCPYCLAAQAVVQRVRNRLGDRVVFAFRHLPIPERHPLAETAAEASESAAAEGRFWECHDALYAAQQQLETEDDVWAAAAAAGLDPERVAAEVREGRWRERVERDARSGIESGARGTPAFFVNGQLHDDVFDAGTLVEALTRAA